MTRTHFGNLREHLPGVTGALSRHGGSQRRFVPSRGRGCLGQARLGGGRGWVHGMVMGCSSQVQNNRKIMWKYVENYCSEMLLMLLFHFFEDNTGSMTAFPDKNRPSIGGVGIHRFGSAHIIGWPVQ